MACAPLGLHIPGIIDFNLVIGSCSVLTRSSIRVEICRYADKVLISTAPKGPNLIACDYQQHPETAFIVSRRQLQHVQEACALVKFDSKGCAFDSTPSPLVDDINGTPRFFSATTRCSLLGRILTPATGASKDRLSGPFDFGRQRPRKSYSKN